MMIKLDDVKKLLIENTDDVLTLYLNVDNATPENQAVTPAWRVWVKNTLRDIPSNLDGTHTETWTAARDWVQDYLNEYAPQSKSLLIFAGANTQQVYEFPFRFENHAAFGKPLVGPLLWAIDEYQPYAVVMVDKEAARFFTSYLGSTDFQDAVEIDLEDYDFAQKTLMPSASAGTGGHIMGQGSNRAAFEDMIDEHRNRFYRQVVEHTGKLLEKQDIERLILGGSTESTHAVKNLMPDRMKAQVVDVVNLPMRYTPTEIFQHILPAALENERRTEIELVNQVIDFAKSKGRGALGEKTVTEALDMQRVELLVIAWPPSNESLANELAFRALQLNSEIELVHGEAAERLNAEGGLGARLYYAL
jgi:peptide chain release factor subunit 1